MSSRSVTRPEPVKGRRRAEVLMAAIRDATRAELAENGFAGVTYEGVARRAQTSKHVLYRRYPTRAHMVIDALPTLWTTQPDVTPADCLRDDLIRLFDKVVDSFRAFGFDNYRSLVAEADAELFASLDEKVNSAAEQTVLPALERARARGELGQRAIPHRAAVSVGVLVRNEIVFSRDVPTTVVADILDTVYLPLVHTLSRTGGR